MTRSGFRPVGIFGPSYVGKTTFVRYLVENGPFIRARLWTTRPPRPQEADPGTVFCTPEQIEEAAESGDWLINSIGPYTYGLDIAEIRAMLRQSHVVLEIAPSTRSAFSQVLPELLTVLMWPEDFALLQERFSHAQDRPSVEREARLRINATDAKERPEAHLTLWVRAHSSLTARRRQLAELQRQLLEALGQR